MTEIRVKGEVYSGDDWAMFVNGIEYSPREIEDIIRWALKVQYDTLDSILQDRGLLALGESLVKAPEEESIGDEWGLVFNHILRTQHILAGLKVPHSWAVKEDDDARRILSEKMQKLGDCIWRARRD